MAANDLKGKVVVITGATTGIGEATAMEFAKYGAKLVLCGRNPEGLQDTKEKCVSLGLDDKDTAIVVGDMRKDETLDSIVTITLDTFDKVDVLFLSAAKLHPKTSPVTIPDSVEALDYYYEMFIKCPYKLTQMFSEELIKTKGTVIINSSVSSFMVNLMATPYSIFKAAQDQMTKLFALTFASKGVRVNAIRPGTVQTNMLRDDNIPALVAAQFEQMFPFCASHTPLRSTLPTAEEIARVVVFLASSQSACMTGSLVTADKGFSMAHPAVDWKEF